MTNSLALEHFQQSLRIPVVDGMYAQGDLLVIPSSMLPEVTVGPDAQWSHVRPEGVEVLRGPAGGNPHTLVAESGTCRWTRSVDDPEGLALGLFTTTAVAYLMHPEHGATGSAPGAYLIRRQREFGAWGSRLVAD
ncbi:hypothetical protein [Nocardia pseudobrasiliensis]|uniref:Uncharacterized protein n=1 Tax=Nocardia pseudobrasiliensis TaxID=45979 RepID=A0A370I098_9NOCA|nr:hypothetical protein [Nocardia pseudobrasiliensis]RDI63611.1 hypothetical protein DFR76_110308 [Nocardia pseudobrasiliensis]